MQAPREVLDLVERFDTHRDIYTSPNYNETQVRREFIDPFFGALGWDVDNRQGFAEQFKHVVHEDSIKIGGTVKAPGKICPVRHQKHGTAEADDASLAGTEDWRNQFAPTSPSSKGVEVHKPVRPSAFLRGPRSGGRT